MLSDLKLLALALALGLTSVAVQAADDKRLELEKQAVYFLAAPVAEAAWDGIFEIGASELMPDLWMDMDARPIQAKYRKDDRDLNYVIEHLARRCVADQLVTCQHLIVEAHTAFLWCRTQWELLGFFGLRREVLPPEIRYNMRAHLPLAIADELVALEQMSAAEIRDFVEQLMKRHYQAPDSLVMAETD